MEDQQNNNNYTPQTPLQAQGQTPVNRGAVQPRNDFNQAKKKRNKIPLSITIALGVFFVLTLVTALFDIDPSGTFGVVFQVAAFVILPIVIGVVLIINRDKYK